VLQLQRTAGNAVVQTLARSAEAKRLALDSRRLHGDALSQLLARLGPQSRLDGAASARSPGRTGALLPRKRRGGGSTPKAKALSKLSSRWGINAVREGTIDDQARLTARSTRGLSAAGAKQQLTAAGWQAWSPYEKDSVWTNLADAFDDIAQSFGGAPAATEILFFDTEYVPSRSGGGSPALVAQRKTHATYSAGIIEVYKAAQRGRFIAERRSAAAKSNTTRVGARFTLGHELGHGIVEAVHASVDQGELATYGKAVGWHKGKLYDIGGQGVRAAIDGGRAPDARFRITGKNWNDTSLHEQPISKYMTEGLSEDLPEAIAAFVHVPAVLKARSPARFKFIEDRRKRWSKALRAAK
jgi:hypothetical protein